MAICLSGANLAITSKFNSHKVKAKEVLEVLPLTFYAIINHPRGFEFYMKVV